MSRKHTLEEILIFETIKHVLFRSYRAFHFGSKYSKQFREVKDCKIDIIINRNAWEFFFLGVLNGLLEADHFELAYPQARHSDTKV